MVLKELPSGKIELVVIGLATAVQFNCNCEDALPYCKAMCCKLRMKYNVELDEAEAQRFRYVTVPQAESKQLLKVLPWKSEDYSCIHLDGENKCSVQEEKPRRCREEHCSPGGNPDDPEIKRRFAGWMLLPTELQI